jgi:hypothetical protein
MTQASTMGLNSFIDLYDSEIIAIEDGPLRYAQQRAGRPLNIDRFTKDLAEQFEQIGLGVEVKVFTTAQDNVWAFEVEIQRRIAKPFDPDQMIHEVVNNLLELPGEGGWIDTNKGMAELARKEREDGAHSHGG